jgi:hypothetical protein
MTAQRRQAALDRLRDQYARARAELADLGYLLQGSVTERRLACGKARCACTTDLQAWHGPYLQWSRKKGGRTVSTYLLPAQAVLCRQWIQNNRKLEKIITKMRELSRRVARLHDIRTI